MAIRNHCTRLDTGGTTTTTTQTVPTDEAVDETLTTTICKLCLATQAIIDPTTVDTSVVAVDDLGVSVTANSVPAPGSGHSVCPKGAPRADL